MVIKLVSLIKKRIGLAIPIPAVFSFSTIHELSNYLEWENGNATEEGDDDETTTFEVINL